MDRAQTKYSIKNINSLCYRQVKKMAHVRQILKTKLYSLICLFNVHFIWLNNMFKSRYSMFKCSSKHFWINWSNMTIYACFPFRNSPHASSINMFFFKFSTTQSHKDWSQINEEAMYLEKTLEVTLSSVKCARRNTVTGSVKWGRGGAPSCRYTEVSKQHCSSRRK